MKTMEKKALSAEQIDAQAAFELPDREVNVSKVVGSVSLLPKLVFQRRGYLTRRDVTPEQPDELYDHPQGHAGV